VRERLKESAVSPNVICPVNQPLEEFFIVSESGNVVRAYQQLFGRLPGRLVLLPKSFESFVLPRVFDDYFKNYFFHIYGYAPQVIFL
jgi:hypothetical protein